MLKVTKKLKVTALTVSDYITTVPEIKNIKMEFRVDKEDFIIPYNLIVITEYFNIIQTNSMCNELFLHKNFEKIQLRSLGYINQQYVETKPNQSYSDDQYMLHTYAEHEYNFRQIFNKYKRLGNALGFHISKWIKQQLYLCMQYIWLWS